jgi:hypothetical protein
MMVLSKIKMAAAMFMVASALVVGGTGLAYRAQAQGPKQEARNVAAAGGTSAPTDESTVNFERLTGQTQGIGQGDGSRDAQTEGPLSTAIMSGTHGLDELEFAKSLMEEMITFEKEIQSKSPEELDEMIEAVEWNLRLEEAKLRRLKQMRASTHQGPKNDQSPSAAQGASVRTKSAPGQSAGQFPKRRPRNVGKGDQPATK